MDVVAAEGLFPSVLGIGEELAVDVFPQEKGGNPCPKLLCRLFYTVSLLVGHAFSVGWQLMDLLMSGDDQSPALIVSAIVSAHFSVF